MKSLDKIGSASIAFFSFLMALGLRNILSEYSDLGWNRWLIFLIASFTFLRFLSGSAVYLWETHAKNDPINKLRASYDYISLVVLGTTGVLACFQSNLTYFMLGFALFSFLAFFWCIIYEMFSNLKFHFWLILNLVMTVIFLLYAGFGDPSTDKEFFGFSLYLLIILAVSVIILFIDIWHQVYYASS